MYILLLAQVAPEKQNLALWSQLLNWSPFVVVIFVMFFVLRRAQARAKSLQDQSFEHMAHMQAKTDQMIDLLREIRDRFDRGL